MWLTKDEMKYILLVWVLSYVAGMFLGFSLTLVMMLITIDFVFRCVDSNKV